MNAAAVDVRELFFTYPDGTEALKGVSVSVADGEAIALVGGNGAGKSTLLLHLNGCLPAPEGSVLVGGNPITRDTTRMVRATVGTVFQDPDDQLFMPTVLEDVAFGPLNAGRTPSDARRIATAALERVGLPHLANRPPYRLSAGEKRMVSIATVLAMEPQTLILDEPSSNLDPRARRRLIELLQSFDHTRIIATHDLELVVEVCSRVIVLDHGTVVAEGGVRDVLGDEQRMLAHGLERPHILLHRHPHGPTPHDNHGRSQPTQ